MTRQDLFNEFTDVTFSIVPSAEEADVQVTLEDVESIRQVFVKVIDRVAMKVVEDSEYTAEDEDDQRLQEEQDEAYPEVEREGVGLD